MIFAGCFVEDTASGRSGNSAGESKPTACSTRREATYDDGVTSSGHIPGKALPRILARIVGICCLAFAGIGLLFSVPTATSVYAGYSFDPKLPYFLEAYTSLLLLTVGVYSGLTYCGIQLLRLRTQVSRFLLGLVISEVVLVMSMGCIWSAISPAIALSVGAATGIGLGGLMPQIVTLFVFWGPAAAIWSHNRTRRLPELRQKRGLCPHCGYDMKSASGTCPECGIVASFNQAPQLLETRRSEV
jgi:hypothetical protein